MKKFTGKIFAGVFTAAIMASAAFVTVGAADYSTNPDYSAPEKTVEIKAEEVKAGATVEKKDAEAVKVTAESLKTLKADETVTFALKDDVTIAVSKVQEGAKDITLGVNVATEDKATKLTSGVEVPAKAVLVTPAQQGEFGMTLTVTVKTELDSKKAKLYYVANDGKVEDVTKASGFAIKDGKATFSIDHASSYVISETEVKGKTDGSPDTGVTLPIALVALAGGSVAVSAIAAKKRK